MKDEFKYYICNERGDFRIKLGFDWDYGQTHRYIYLENTAFADYAPIPKFIYQTAEEAQHYLKIIREWIARLIAARPKSKEWIKNAT